MMRQVDRGVHWSNRRGKKGGPGGVKDGVEGRKRGAAGRGACYRQAQGVRSYILFVGKADFRREFCRKGNKRTIRERESEGHGMGGKAVCQGEQLEEKDEVLGRKNRTAQPWKASCGG